MEIYLDIIDAIGKIGIFLIAVLGLTISWFQYDLQRYKLKIKFLLVPFGTDLHKQIAKQGNKEHLFLLIITNTSRHSFEITGLVNDDKDGGVIDLFIQQNKKNRKEFGFLIEKGKQKMYHNSLNINRIEQFKKSKRLYVQSSFKKFRVNQSDVKKFLKELEKISK